MILLVKILNVELNVSFIFRSIKRKREREKERERERERERCETWLFFLFEGQPFLWSFAIQPHVAADLPCSKR
jgi:hypothetical protein